MSVESFLLPSLAWISLIFLPPPLPFDLKGFPLGKHRVANREYKTVQTFFQS